MIRVLRRAVVVLGSAALGLAIASLVVPEMSLDGRSFVVVVVVLAVPQSVLAPFITTMALRAAAPRARGQVSGQARGTMSRVSTSQTPWTTPPRRQ